MGIGKTSREQSERDSLEDLEEENADNFDANVKS